ncbi:MAG: hypothetical protein WC046_08655 [Candidatus Bathyarchaeia archaeon]
MSRKPAAKVFISEEPSHYLTEIGLDHKVSKWINNMKMTLKENMYAGELIRKSQIPKQYISRYGVNNLYWYSHPEGFRSWYPIVIVCPNILDIMPHPKYDKVFRCKTT